MLYLTTTFALKPIKRSLIPEMVAVWQRGEREGDGQKDIYFPDYYKIISGFHRGNDEEHKPGVCF